MTFRLLTTNDIPLIVALLNNLDIARSCAVPYPFTREDAERCTLGEHYGLFYGNLLLAIVSFTDGELGYAVEQLAWNYGNGSKAVDEFFNLVKPFEVRAEVLSTNVASLRILLKRGFEIIGWREHDNKNWPKKVPVLKLYWRRDYE